MSLPVPAPAAPPKPPPNRPPPAASAAAGAGTAAATRFPKSPPGAAAAAPQHAGAAQTPPKPLAAGRAGTGTAPKLELPPPAGAGVAVLATTNAAATPKAGAAGDEVTLLHDGAAATRARCLICLEEVSTHRGLTCSDGHLICSACLQRYICSLAGSAKMRSLNGALDCLGAHQQAFSFGRSMVEPLLFGDALRLYLETVETTQAPDEGEACTPESMQPELHEALNLGCPSCKVFCDPDPDGCIAMTCRSCDGAFCWLCIQPCGRDAHPHCREVHGGYFPSRSDVNRWHRRLRWHQVDAVLQRSFGGRPPEREEALRLCARSLADSAIGLWPFPNVEPSVGVMLGVAAHVQAAQLGRIDELRALLDETPELINRANDRGMTALMAAAHGGHTAVVTMLLERGADVICGDDRGVSALDYAIRENRQEVVLAILDHAGHLVNEKGPCGKTALLVACEYGREAIARALLDRGAKVDALKKGLNVESAKMLAKIGAEKGIMLSGMQRDQTEADFSSQRLQPADAILIGSDLKFMAVLTKLDLGLSSIGVEGAKAIAEALKVNAVLTVLNLSVIWIGDEGAKAIAEALKVNAVLTDLCLDYNNIGAEGAIAIAEALKVNAVLKNCNLLKNHFDIESATMLAKVGAEKGIMLSGMKRDQTEAVFSVQRLQPADGILMASDLKFMAVLTSVDLRSNSIGDDGAKAIAEALKVNAVLTDLALWINGIGDEGAIAIAEALKVNAVLTKLNLNYNSMGVAGETAVRDAVKDRSGFVLHM
eukprot:jgi/Chrpa1/20666/Chrysochromulina_OHIO_Genome00006199-RA